MVLNCSHLCLGWYKHDWEFKRICIHSLSSVLSPRSSSHFCFTCCVSSGKASINPWYSLEINFRGLSDCLKIVWSFLLVQCLLHRENSVVSAKIPFSSITRLVFPGCLTLMRPLSPSDPAQMRHDKELHWCTFIRYIIHEYNQWFNNLNNHLSQTVAYPSTQDGTLYPFTDYNILQNVPELCRVVFPGCLTLLRHDELSVVYWLCTMKVTPVELFIPCLCEK